MPTLLLKFLEVLKTQGPKLAKPLFLLGCGVLIGWLVKPDVVRVEEKIKTIEVEKQVVVVQEKVRVEIVKVKDTQVVERWHREKTEERRPDGTVIAKEVEDRNIDSIVRERENSTEVKVVEVEKQVVVERKVEVFREVKPVLPDWHVGVLAGVAPRFDAPLASPIMLGLEGERRIAGPLWLGIWGMAGSPATGLNITNGAIGIKASMEF